RSRRTRGARGIGRRDGVSRPDVLGHLPQGEPGVVLRLRVLGGPAGGAVGGDQEVEGQHAEEQEHPGGDDEFDERHAAFVAAPRAKTTDHWKLTVPDWAAAVEPTVPDAGSTIWAAVNTNFWVPAENR